MTFSAIRAAILSRDAVLKAVRRALKWCLLDLGTREKVSEPLFDFNSDQRSNQDTRVVRDTGFEPVTPTVSR